MGKNRLKLRRSQKVRSLTNRFKIRNRNTSSNRNRMKLRYGNSSPTNPSGLKMRGRHKNKDGRAPKLYNMA